MQLAGLGCCQKTAIPFGKLGGLIGQIRRAGTALCQSFHNCQGQMQCFELQAVGQITRKLATGLGYAKPGVITGQSTGHKPKTVFFVFPLFFNMPSPLFSTSTHLYAALSRQRPNKQCGPTAGGANVHVLYLSETDESMSQVLSIRVQKHMRIHKDTTKTESHTW